MNAGIDYGMGTTNIDHDTGIRFGVIPQNDVLQAWADSSEPHYGPPTCPKCGNEARHTEDLTGKHPDVDEYDCARGACGDFACDDCAYLFDGEDAFGDEPISYVLDGDGYLAECGSDGDIFIIRSPYFTHAQFCSPCAPGAGYLANPYDDGPKTYCFAADWFDDDSPCPYPVYRVDTGELVYSPEADDEL